MPNNRLLILSELPVVKHRRSAGSSFFIRVKCHEGLGKQWCENILYIHWHCSKLSLSIRTPSVKKQKKKSSVRVGRCQLTNPIIMAIAHPPVVVVTLGMVQHGVRTSTLSLGQEHVNVDGRTLYQHKDPTQYPHAMTRASRTGVSMASRVRVNHSLQRTFCNVGPLVNRTIAFGLVAFYLQMGRHGS